MSFYWTVVLIFTLPILCGLGFMIVTVNRYTARQNKRVDEMQRILREARDALRPERRAP